VEKGSAVRRHIGSFVQSRSYRNALEKCVKLPVGGEKDVIVVREVFS
jgi:hypothetical protein